MSIDEAIARERQLAKEQRSHIGTFYSKIMGYDDEYIKKCEVCAEEHEQLAEWLEELKTIENIMLIYNANWYADEDDGVPDCEVLESIWNVIQDNGLDIDIEQDYRKGKSDGYNKAIDDFERIMCEELKDYIDHKDYMCVGLSLHKFTRDLAEQLKAGGENEM